MQRICNYTNIKKQGVYNFKYVVHSLKFFTRIFAGHSIDNSMISYYYTLV